MDHSKPVPVILGNQKPVPVILLNFRKTSIGKYLDTILQYRKRLITCELGIGSMEKVMNSNMNMVLKC